MALLGSGLASVLLLVAAVAAQWMKADAGGLERGETARPSGKQLEQSPGRRGDTGSGLPATRSTPASGVPDRTPSPLRGPIALPVPLKRPPPGQMAPTLPPLPRARERSPLPAPLPPQLPEPRFGQFTPDAGAMNFETTRRSLQRPPEVPVTRGREAELIALGARLFSEQKLSADHKSSCASCHDPARAFSDGLRRARGKRGQELGRNTPSLWNIEAARAFGWEAQTASESAQIKACIERDDGMDATLEAGVVWLQRDADTVAAFGRAFGGVQAPTTDTLVAALQAYQHWLVSPETRFDRWIGGDIYGLGERELAGLRLFTGKGGCVSCHGGWRFTDDHVHDVGSGGGRGGGVKTPSLREAAWTAPYMHDGRLPTLDDVVARHGGGMTLSERERGDLVAFLRSLSSDRQPSPPALPSP